MGTCKKHLKGKFKLDIFLLYQVMCFRMYSKDTLQEYKKSTL